MTANNGGDTKPKFFKLGAEAEYFVKTRVSASGELFSQLWSMIHEPQLGTWLRPDELATLNFRHATRTGSQHAEFAAKKIITEMSGVCLLHRYLSPTLRSSVLFDGFLKYRESEFYTGRFVSGEQSYESVREFIEWPSVVCVGISFKSHWQPSATWNEIARIDRAADVVLRFLFCPAFDDEGGIVWFG
jgi:hypothetical protein